MYNSKKWLTKKRTPKEKAMEFAWRDALKKSFQSTLEGKSFLKARFEYWYNKLNETTI